MEVSYDVVVTLDYPEHKVNGEVRATEERDAVFEGSVHPGIFHAVSGHLVTGHTQSDNSVEN